MGFADAALFFAPDASFGEADGVEETVRVAGALF
jgi:hypothetical protein